MKIKVKDEQELMQLAVDAIHILHHLRRTTKDWKEHYGCYRRERMFLYEEKADAFLSKLNVEQIKQATNIQIEINGEDKLP